MLDIIGLYLVRGGCKIKFGLNMAPILLGHQGWFTNWQGTFFICVISNLAKLNQPAKVNVFLIQKSIFLFPIESKTGCSS